MDDIARQIDALRDRLIALDRERSEITERLSTLQRGQVERKVHSLPIVAAGVTMASSSAAKVALFRSLFRGREDVYPRRWENPKTGKAGYAPACRNEWVRGVCGKPQVKCGECPNQAFIPVGVDAIHSHLAGKASGTSADFTVYPAGRSRYHARLTVSEHGNGRSTKKVMYLGCFDDAESAARAYDSEARKHPGRSLNFPNVKNLPSSDSRTLSPGRRAPSGKRSA